jgi:hypothetical protein
MKHKPKQVTDIDFQSEATGSPKQDAILTLKNLMCKHMDESDEQSIMFYAYMNMITKLNNIK